MDKMKIALIGDYNPEYVAHQAIPQSITLCADNLKSDVSFIWINSDELLSDSAKQFEEYDGVWCVPGSPYKNYDGIISAIKFCRENKKPFLGTCGGFQHLILEYARNVLQIKNAEHAELDSEAENPIITPLECSLVEKRGRILLEKDSHLKKICNVNELDEGYHCSYGVNPEFENLIKNNPLIISGRDEEGSIRAVELTTHPFYIGTLFQPERSALMNKAHPIIKAFLNTALHTKKNLN